jgi:hypothetical protein
MKKAGGVVGNLNDGVVRRNGHNKESGILQNLNCNIVAIVGRLFLGSGHLTE